MSLLDCGKGETYFPISSCAYLTKIRTQYCY